MDKSKTFQSRFLREPDFVINFTSNIGLVHQGPRNEATYSINRFGPESLLPIRENKAWFLLIEQIFEGQF